MKPGSAQRNVTSPLTSLPQPRFLDTERALVLGLDLLLVGLDVLEIEARDRLGTVRSARSWTSSSFQEMRIVSPSLPRKSG